jgi:hypothetical protein
MGGLTMSESHTPARSGIARHYVWLLLSLLVPAACDTPALPEAAGTCGEALVDTTGWKRMVSRYGTFAILLPPSAVERLTGCTDSQCGRIEVGAWTIGYDSGPLAGPGDSAHYYGELTDERRCSLHISGQPGQVLVARFRTDPRPSPIPPAVHDSSWAGHFIAAFAVPAPVTRGGLYLSMNSAQESDRAAFLTAIASLRLLPDTQRSRP